MADDIVPIGCTCGEVFGEDPACPLHGRGTAWAELHPDDTDLTVVGLDLSAGIDLTGHGFIFEDEGGQRVAFTRCTDGRLIIGLGGRQAVVRGSKALFVLARLAELSLPVA